MPSQSDPKSPSANLEGDLIAYSAGSRLVTENELSRKMFIIKKGKVRVYKDYMGQKITLAVLGEGEVFGELSFFDAAPRSASVDALTDIEAIVIDGKQANDQIKHLPSWAVPIFKTIIYRFREADQKLTVLQSMNEFQKRVLKNDSVAKNIYIELMRFIRTLEILYSRAEKSGPPVAKDVLYKEIDDLLGRRVVGLGVFWKVLRENDFMDPVAEERNEVILNLDSLKNWKEYLEREVDSERFLMLSFSSVAVLRKIVSGLFEKVSGPDIASDAKVALTIDDLRLKAMPLVNEGLGELSRSGVIEHKGEQISFHPAVLLETFNYQSLLKAFDHTIVCLD